MGAWIEITQEIVQAYLLWVAPLVGAWIEIRRVADIKEKIESLLSWERGLKLF